MTSIARELDHVLQVANPATAQRMERLVRDAVALVVGVDEATERGGRAERLFAAMDGVKEFGVAGRLRRDEVHSR